MNHVIELEEKLREYCCIGDEKSARALINNGVNINAQNSMNGWSCLHWACKRNHRTLVEYLLARGADAELKTLKGEKAVNLTNDSEIKKMLISDGDKDCDNYHHEEVLPFIPNYLQNPVFPYAEDLPESMQYNANISDSQTIKPSHEKDVSIKPRQEQYAGPEDTPNELVLKVRIANGTDKDFIEVEIEKSQLLYGNLLKICCEELDVNPSSVAKIRKLPNTIIRKDKDVSRLKEEQELEIVTTE